MKSNLTLSYYKLAVIEEQLTIEQIIHARRFRNWKKYDKLKEEQKIMIRFEELEIYIDDIDPEYIPKSFKPDTEI
jgi:hypothetical protein